MALTGDMKDFGVSEILQLIGLQKKTGVLTVTDKKRKVEILFEQGNIVKADHQPEQDLYDLGSTLARAGLVPASLVQSAKTEAQRTVKPLPQVLLSAQAVDLEQLKSVICLIHREIIYSLFLWKEGDYSFDQQAQASYVHQWTQPISSEGVLMDGYRIKDEWPLVERVLPDLEARLEKEPGDFGPGDRLESEEAEVYKLVDGSRTAMDVVFLSRMGMFETLKLLKELIEKDRVTVEDRPGAAAGPSKSKTMLLPAAAVAVLVLGLAALVLGVYRNVERLVFFDSSNPGAAALEAVGEDYREERVSNALTLYSALEGRYPETLEALAESGLVPGGALSSGPGGFEYEVDPDGKSCVLTLTPPARP